MKKINYALVKCSGIVASLALMIATLSTASATSYVFHQPLAPKSLAKYSK